MLLRNIKKHLRTKDMIFDYYPKDGKEIYIDPSYGCWQLHMVKSYPLEDIVDLYSNDVFMDSCTWDEDLDIKIINSSDYAPLPTNGISHHEMFENNKCMIDHCERMNIFYIPKTRTNPPRFKK